MADSVAQEFALAARKRLIAKASDEPEVVAAREDDTAFCEWVFRDEQAGGAPIIQAPHHRLFSTRLAEVARAQPALIVVPWHGEAQALRMEHL